MSLILSSINSIFLCSGINDDYRAGAMPIIGFTVPGVLAWPEIDFSTIRPIKFLTEWAFWLS